MFSMVSENREVVKAHGVLEVVQHHPERPLGETRAHLKEKVIS